MPPACRMLSRPRARRHPTIPPPGSASHYHAEPYFNPGRLIHFHHFWHENKARSLVVHITSSKPVGNGAFGKVYLGEPNLGGDSYTIALKVIPQTEDPIKLQLISRELEAIKSLSGQKGPHVLRYLGVTSAGPYTIIATDYMPNGTMAEYLKRTPDADYQRLVLQVAEGLTWLHDTLRIVHGDIKSGNVLIGDKDDAVIADFGLATTVGKDPLSMTTATSIRNYNTFAFAAPELLGLYDEATTRPRSKTVKSDVYAFAMFMVEVFTGAPPWSHVNLNGMGITLKLKTGIKHPRPPGEAAIRGLTDSWWKICLQCWEYEPSMRPGMRAVWDELKTNRRHARLLTQHSKQIISIAFTHGGQHLVSHSAKGSVQASNGVSGRVVSSSDLGHGGNVTCAAIAPSGEQIASGHDDGTVHLWDTRRGHRKPSSITLKGHTDRVHAVAFSPDGTRLVSCAQDKTMFLWTLSRWPQTRARIADKVEGEHEVLSVAFAPAGKHVAAGSANGKICLWSADFSAFTRVEAHERGVSAVCFARESGLLVTGSSDGALRLWSRTAQRPRAVLELAVRGEPVRRAIISPSGQYVASVADKSPEIQIRSAASGTPLGAPLLCPEWVAEIAFSPDGKSLVAGCGNGAVYIWDLS